MATPKKGNKPARKVIRTRRPVREGRSASSSEKVQANLKSSVPSLSMPAGSKPVIYALLTAIIIIAALWTGYAKYYSAPKRVFNTMLANNLSTEGFTRDTSQAACVPNSQGTNIIQTSFSPSPTIHCITHINNGSIKLTIESIGNTGGDYQRYSFVQTSAATAKQDKYSKIYDMWIKNSGSPSAQPNLYGQLLNTPVLFANLTQSQRQELISSLSNVYKVDYKNVAKERSGLRETYTYNVEVPLKKFATTEKTYADILNLPIASRINPQSYPDSSSVAVKFSVDVLSRHLKQVQFQSVTETYSSYGVAPIVNIPTKTVSLQQLQNAFQSISK